MITDLDNMRKMMETLGDDGFVNALTKVEKLVEDVDATLERVERIEGEAEQAVREANEALHAVDNRLKKFDETISLLEAKIEAGFSIGFFFFALNQYLEGQLILAVALFVMGLLGASSLAVTIITLPQVKRLRQVGRYATDRLDKEKSERRDGKRQKSAKQEGKTETGSEQSAQSQQQDSESGEIRKSRREIRRERRQKRREQ